MSVQTFMFLVLIPALIALGHDFYLFYVNIGLENPVHDFNVIVEEKGFQSFFASLGFIWTNYHPGSYKWIAQNLDEGTWSVINAFLAYKALYVGLAFAGFFYAVLAVLRVLGKGPFAGESVGKFASGTRTDEILGRSKQRIKYKRK